ncbi:LacI family transcriptional regulator [Acidocella aquatica]|uniref:LacI family transcriptional regulator n=1 Tax=Acidocella aquatica TaxID=1922313 RepID=A0ABQ6A554_9PROT|nr:LacI family transcriptional regulator [Acidocella aquatica]
MSSRARANVVAAAKELAIPRVLPEVGHGLIHLDILLPDNGTPFFRRLNQALQRAIPLLNKRIVVHRKILPEQDEAAMIRAVLRCPYPRQGLIIAAPDTIAMRCALQEVLARGEHVAMVVTNVAELAQARYVGIDNYAAGRTAGYLLGRFCHKPGRVLLLSGRADYRGHLERVTGCTDIMGEAFAHLRCEHLPGQTSDDSDRCYMAVSEAFKHGERIAGIYNTGGGSPGIEAALRRFADHGKVCWVAHELSDDHQEYLRLGILDLVIDQDPDGQATMALQHVLMALGMSESSASGVGPGEFRLYLPENMRGENYMAL